MSGSHQLVLSDEQRELVLQLLRNRVTLLRRPSDPSHPVRQTEHYELAAATLAAMQGRVAATA